MRAVAFIVAVALLSGCAPKFGQSPDGYRFISRESAYSTIEREIRGEPSPALGSEFLYRFSNGWAGARDVRFAIRPRYQGDGLEAKYMELAGPLEYVFDEAWEGGRRTDRQIYAAIVEEMYVVNSETCHGLDDRLEALSKLVVEAAADVTVKLPDRVWLDSPNVRRYSISDGHTRSTVVSEVEVEADLYQATASAIDYVKDCAAAN